MRKEEFQGVLSLCERVRGYLEEGIFDFRGKSEEETMSASIDRVMIAMKIHDIEEPYDLPDDPEYCSREENMLSLIGRVLNPDKQNISDLILDMPKKWQLYDKVRGVALSSERFQFIFMEEEDLEYNLKRGVQTYNQ